MEKGSEKLKQVLRVLLQFEGTMREGTEDCSRCRVSWDGPVSVGLDNFEGLHPPTERSKLLMDAVVLSSV